MTVHPHTQITRVRYFFKENRGTPVVQQPSYSPEMTPCDLCLFLKSKIVTKTKRSRDLMTLTPSNKILRSICVVFRKTLLKNVSNNEATADISA
jgi:hypothetical protein